ncbi:MAG: hypothetical protein QF877_18480, partial [Gammaproteobacteria bacterium]|nr:hypothetical protein [Gammaproteobacteria bacterium]
MSSSFGEKIQIHRVTRVLAIPQSGCCVYYVNLRHKFKLELDGRWSATVSWAGDDNYQAVTETFQLNVVKRFG